MVYRRSSDARTMPIPALPGLPALLAVMEYRCLSETTTLAELISGDGLDPQEAQAAFDWLAEHRFVRVNKDGSFRAELRIRLLEKRLKVGLHHPRPRAPMWDPPPRAAPVRSHGPRLELRLLQHTDD